MKKYQHGGRIYDTQIKLDFSANINPLGMPQGVKNALINGVDTFSFYPDTDCTELVKRLSEHEKTEAENIVCANGAADLIYRIVYAVKPKKALLMSPTFSEYEKALCEVGCGIEYYKLLEKNDFLPDEKIVESITNDIEIFFICSPNNPVGNVIDTVIMKKIISRCAENNTLLVIDECFMDFVSDSENYSVKPYLQGNMIILKAFTKIYAMAGLRLGYALFGDNILAEKVKHTGQCWSVSTPAQLAGAAALDESEYCEKSVELISREREYLYAELKKLGFKVYPSCTNFLLFHSDILLEEKLGRQGISIRCCDNYMVLDKHYYRTAVRLHSENEALINALERILKNG